MNADPPIPTDIVCEEQPGGVTFRVPPVGLRRAGGGRALGCGTFMGFTLCTAAFAALITIASLVGAVFGESESIQLPTVTGWNGVFGLAFCWAIPAGFLAIAWHIGNTRAVLDVRNGTLAIEFAGPLRKRRFELARSEIRSIDQGVAGTAPGSEGPASDMPVLIITTVRDRPKRFGIFQPIRYQELEFFAGRSRAELAWMAATLKQALDLPPPEPMTFWKWLRRDSPGVL